LSFYPPALPLNLLPKNTFLGSKFKGRAGVLFIILLHNAIAIKNATPNGVPLGSQALGLMALTRLLPYQRLSQATLTSSGGNARKLANEQ